ncbi:creatininase [Paraburkholderia aromaticivorans]|uniref:creatininase n=1 Tax=Paraburkholderia aromaticivorans TaxID=2026199 RepID=UPI001455F9BA|nr:creatininase [Paraburkholderia aromaticivorans]
MEKRVVIGELASPEYMRRVKDEAQPILIPIGALEQHGPHMSMNPDVLLPGAVAVAVAQQIGALVAPAIAYGYKSQQKSGGGNHLCGTTSLDGHTLSSTVKDILKEFARHGARKICLINGHFENSMFVVEGIDLAIRELRWEGIHDFQVVMLSYWDFVNEDTIARIYPEGFPGWAVEHGGVLETSLMLHLHPHLVDMSCVPTHAAASFPPYDVFPAIPEWTPASGCLSSAAAASAEKGALLFDVCVQGISRALSEAYDARVNASRD